jgi:hypothetical protein
MPMMQLVFSVKWETTVLRVLASAVDTIRGPAVAAQADALFKRYHHRVHHQIVPLLPPHYSNAPVKLFEVEVEGRNVLLIKD